MGRWGYQRAARQAAQGGLRTRAALRRWLPRRPARPARWLLRPLRSRRPPQVGGAAQAVIRDAPGGGIWFGPDGLHIPLLPGEERAAKSRLGSYYASLPGGGRSLFAQGERGGRGGAGLAQLGGLRVYVAEGEGERWELDGIVWKTSRG